MTARNGERGLGVFPLVMMNFVAIANVRTLPSIAPYGLSMLFFYFVATFCFLVPTALVSAELASGFPGDGGIYHWVSKAMGNRAGFFAVWLQNANNFICFPMSLSFIASTLAHGTCARLADSKLFTISVILAVVWGGTLFTLKGAKLTGLASVIGGIVGTLLPVFLIVAIGVFWLLSGRPSQVEFSLPALVPNLSSPGSISLFTGVLLGFAGLEMSANHVLDVDNPRKKYPRAIFISAALILAVSVFGSLAIAIVVPSGEIFMNAGAMQAMARFFSDVNLQWMMPLVSLAMVIGSIAWFCVWVSGPPRALHVTACGGSLPKWFCALNRHGMPVNIMIAQAVIASILSALFIFAESVNAAFWMLTVGTAQFLLLMYMLMFLAAIVLKFKCADIPRPYEVPFKKFGMCAIAGVGFAICAIFYVIGFFPPDDIFIERKLTYFLTIGAINVIIGVLPVLWANRSRGAC